MADIVVTAANVLEVDDVKKAVGIAGETITAGQLLYEKGDTDAVKRMYKCLNSGEAEAKCKGISLNGAAINQPVVYAKEGTVNPGGTLTQGMAYFVSNTAGAIAPAADIATTGEQISFVGFAQQTNELVVILKATGNAVD